jgi:hypothetical protein
VNLDELDPEFTKHWMLLGISLPSAVAVIAETGWAMAAKYSLDDYYAPAAQLSGQSLDELAAVYDALVADYRDLDDGVEEFQSAMTAVFEGWTGSAKLACSTYGGRLVDFVNGERDVARDLAAALLAYATIMHTARQNWLKLADGLVEAVRKKQEDDSNKLLQIAITALAAVFTAALGVVTAGTGEAALVGLLEYVADVSAEAGKQALGGDTYEEIADSYFKACRELQDQVDETIRTEVLDRITPYAEHRPTPPPPPLDLPRFEAHPGVLVPPNPPPGVGRWVDKRETKSQQPGGSNISARLDA